jgi:anti-sigma B factor antagonist
MVIATLPTVRPRQPDGLTVRKVTAAVPGIDVSCRAAGGCLVVALSGALDVTSAPALREYLLRLLRRAASNLIIDLSAVDEADSRGLAVLVGTERRARLLGGFLRLVAPKPAVNAALRATRLNLQLDIYPTLEAAFSCPATA